MQASCTNARLQVLRPAEPVRLLLPYFYAPDAFFALQLLHTKAHVALQQPIAESPDYQVICCPCGAEL
jgi:hypothetical protein